MFYIKTYLYFLPVMHTKSFTVKIGRGAKEDVCGIHLAFPNDVVIRRFSNLLRYVSPVVCLSCEMCVIGCVFGIAW